MRRIMLMDSHNKNIIRIPEFRFGSGYEGVAKRRSDVFEISAASGEKTINYEIKVSRKDFLSDIKDDSKQRAARLFASHFYYCAPIGLIAPAQVPVWAGLMEFDLDKPLNDDSYHYVNVFRRIVVSAPLLPRENPTWQLVISAARRQIFDPHKSLLRVAMRKKANHDLLQAASAVLALRTAIRKEEKGKPQ